MCLGDFANPIRGSKPLEEAELAPKIANALIDK